MVALDWKIEWKREVSRLYFWLNFKKKIDLNVQKKSRNLDQKSGWWGLWMSSDKNISQLQKVEYF